MHKIVHKLPNVLQMWPCWYSGLLMFTLLSQSAAPPHFPALLSRWWKISQQTRGKWQMWTRKIQISAKNAQKKFVMWHSWLWCWRSRVLWPHCPFSLGSITFWANLNPIRKPGRHLPDIISYHPNEDWCLARGTNWCCPWEKGSNGSPGLLLATQTLSDRADAISCPPQSWQTAHGDALSGEKLV